MNSAANPSFTEPPECYECGGDMLVQPHNACELICENEDCGHCENHEPDFS